MASSGGKHRFEKYLDIPFVFGVLLAIRFIFSGRFSEKKQAMVGEIIKDNTTRFSLPEVQVESSTR